MNSYCSPKLEGVVLVIEDIIMSSNSQYGNPNAGDDVFDFLDVFNFDE